jgi:cardiolipin synthase
MVTPALLLACSHGAICAALMLRILSRRNPPGVSMAWILLVLAVPVGGALLYVIIGERRLGRRWIERAEAEHAVLAVLFARLASGAAVDPAVLGPAAEPTARLARALGGIDVMRGHRVELFSESADILQGLIDDIDACRTHCSLEFYIWHHAGRVLNVIDALVRAAQRGVKVTILMDGLGSRPFTRSAGMHALHQAGVEVIVVRPVSAFRLAAARADLRNHRKLAVFDHHIAWTGSFNLADPVEFKRDAGVGPWIDAMVRIEGPSCAVLGAMTAAMAFLQQGPRGKDFGSSPEALERAARVLDDRGPVALQPFASGPGFAYQHVESVLLSAIYSARHELILTTPYFAPGESIVMALRSAARRGVAVTLIVPLRCDSRLVQYASASYFSDLLAAGIRIERFDGGLLHTKSMVVDGEFAVFGTVNMDLRSFHLNFELSTLIYDREMAERLLALQRSYLRRCKPLDARLWEGRGLGRRILENAAQLASPLL